MVKSVLEKLAMPFLSINLGVVETPTEINEEQREAFRISLLESGLVLLDDSKNVLVEKIKTCIIEMVHYSDEIPKVNFSDYLSEKLHYDYTYLSNCFSEVKGMTIQHYIITHKVEKVKELLLYDVLSLTEISYKLHYSSIAHLSSQFKKVTGLAPSFYKKLKEKRTRNLEDL